MKRWIYIILFAVVLIAPFVLRLALSRADGSAGASESKPSFRLIIITPHNQDIRKEFAQAFSNWHSEQFNQSVEIDFRVPGGTNDIRRQLESTYRKYRDDNGTLPDDAYIGIDLVWGGGDYFFDVELKPLGILQPMQIDPKLLVDAFPQPTLAGVRLYDYVIDAQRNQLQPPRWVGVCLSSFGIVFNPDLYRDLGMDEPTGWHDLTDPRLVGMLALADPLRSGSASVAFSMVIQRAMSDAEAQFAGMQRMNQLSTADLDALEKTENPQEIAELKKELAALRQAYQDALSQGWKQGMAQLLLIAANARYFTDSSNHVPQDVGNGQAAAGIAIDFYGRVFQETVGPERCRFISPRGATAITPDPIAILHGVRGERQRVATRFVEFLLSPQGQRLWIQKAGSPGGPTERALRRLPIRPDLYAGSRAYWTDDVNPFTDANGFNVRAEWSATMSETRLIWAAAWMDARSSLIDAYHAILKISDRSRRDRLLSQLADLPITRSEVEQLRMSRRQMEKSNPSRVEEWKAKQRIDYAKRFRAHYALVERAAASNR